MTTDPKRNLSQRTIGQLEVVRNEGIQQPGKADRTALPLCSSATNPSSDRTCGHHTSSLFLTSSSSSDVVETGKSSEAVVAVVVVGVRYLRRTLGLDDAAVFTVH